MFTNDYISVIKVRFHPFKDGSSPASLFKSMTLILTAMNSHHVVPSCKVPSFPRLMQPIVNRNLMSSCSFEQVKDMGDCVCFFQRIGEEGVQLSIWMDEVVVRIDEEDCSIGVGIGSHGGW